MRDEQFDLHARIEDQHWWFVARRAILTRLIHRVLPPSKSILVMDVGCGTGANVASLNAQYSCVGVDISEHAIMLARRRFPKVPFICGDAREVLRHQDEKTMLLLLLDVLEHIQDDQKFFLEIVGLMKSGDYLLVTVPASMALWSPQDENHGHYRRYDANSLAQLWNGLGVKPILVTHFNTLLFPIIYLIRRLNRYRNTEWGEAGTDLNLPPMWMNSLLSRIFSSEAIILDRAYSSGCHKCLPFGVSLMTLLRKDNE